MGTLKVMRYCRICNLYRPPTRTVHCYTCDNCVFGFDHHCIWLGTCIGGGNYTRFLTFLTILVTWIGFMVGSCVHHISALKSIQAIVILSYTCCVITISILNFLYSSVHSFCTYTLIIWDCYSSIKQHMSLWKILISIKESHCLMYFWGLGNIQIFLLMWKTSWKLQGIHSKIKLEKKSP